ncbi:MAG TPA: FMN-binding protein [Thermoanaerobaculia bacterium]|nr:FMN-binding protein [Thermoanaerobaculia bacterium]
MSAQVPTASPVAPPPPVWILYRAMVGVALVCGFFIVLVFELTKPVIARNRAAALEAAILEVLPGAAASRTFAWTGDGFAPVAAGAEEGGAAGGVVHAAWDGAGDLVGVAVEASSMGYQDTLTMLYGYSFERRAIVGLRVLESRETPGLGDRIETDPAFRANFETLDVSLAGEGASARIANPIVAVKQGEKTEPWEIDGITGATISSVAVAAALRASTATWIARLAAAEETLRAAGPRGDT